MIYVTRATWKPTTEVFTLPSETVPGQTLSMSELLKRYVRGEAVEVFEAQWGVPDDVPTDIQYMDKQDQLTMAREIRTAIKRHQDKPGPTPAPPAPPPLPGTPTPPDPAPAPVPQ